MCVQYCGGAQYRGRYHDKCRGISWEPWGVQYRGGIMGSVGDIMMHVGDIMSTVAVFSIVRDTIFCYMSTSTVLNTPHGPQDIPHMNHDIPHGTQITKDNNPHGPEHPLSPPPPHVTHDIPPRASWYPPQYSCRAGGAGPTTLTLVGPKILSFMVKALYFQGSGRTNNCQIGAVSNGRTNLALLPPPLSWYPPTYFYV